ncbi:MAG: CCA tRNA nucleotidyltransferase [Candidatus Dormibacteria bacterium]
MARRIDPPALPDLDAIFEVVESESEKLGGRALVVGGYVRDRLLGGKREEAIREVDILVEGGLGIVLADAVATRLGIHPPVVFERFGTAHLDVGERAIEFVSTRRERYQRDSRKPEVSPGSLRDDVMRRDFTVNTLLMDWDGSVLDLTGRGLDDLANHRIVTPLEPAITFEEDPLRMLRAARFAATLGFEVDPAVADAISRHAARLQPPTVSMERIRDEFSKLMMAADVLRGLQILDETGLLVQILPELEPGKGMAQGGWHSHDVFGHGLLAASLSPADLITRLAGLLHDVGKPATHELHEGKISFIGHQDVGAVIVADALRRLRYPGDLIAAVAKLVRLHMRPIQYNPDGWEDRAVRRLVRDAGPELGRLLDLARADMRASHYPDVKKIDHLEARVKRLDAEAIYAIQSPLSGNELMTRTGLPAGPWIKRAKLALEEAILDGVLNSDPEVAWQYLKEHPDLLKG